MEEAALKLVFNEQVGPRPMEKGSRVGVAGWGIRWSSSLEPVKAISQVLFEKILPWIGIKQGSSFSLHKGIFSAEGFSPLKGKKEAKAKIKEEFRR